MVNSPLPSCVTGSAGRTLGHSARIPKCTTITSGVCGRCVYRLQVKRDSPPRPHSRTSTVRFRVVPRPPPIFRAQLKTPHNLCYSLLLQQRPSFPASSLWTEGGWPCKLGLTQTGRSQSVQSVCFWFAALNGPDCCNVALHL